MLKHLGHACKLANDSIHMTYNRLEALPKEEHTISTSPGCSPASSQAPRPCSPSTPNAKDSSTSMRYLKRVFSSCTALSGARSPVDAKMPSVTMKRRLSGFLPDQQSGWAPSASRTHAQVLFRPMVTI